MSTFFIIEGSMNAAVMKESHGIQVGFVLFSSTLASILFKSSICLDPALPKMFSRHSYAEKFSEVTRSFFQNLRKKVHVPCMVPKAPM
jgi:hypothetical protein